MVSACEDRRLMLGALFDGELDAANSMELEAHVRRCPGCTEELRRLEALRGRLNDEGRTPAPAALRRSIEAMIGPADGKAAAVARPAIAARPGRGARGFAAGAVTALAASLALAVAIPQLTAGRIEDELVANHVRSLLANHLVDVATSDRHTVKPWFNGRIDFAPPVVELADEGFPLVGGRVDYLDGKVAAALVYRRRLHTINVFVRPVSGVRANVPLRARREGYSLVRWTQGGLEFWAVSDLELDELRVFQRAFVARAAVPAPA
jgi:anti-sigma factor RsiW